MLLRDVTLGDGDETGRPGPGRRAGHRTGIVRLFIFDVVPDSEDLEFLVWASKMSLIYSPSSSHFAASEFSWVNIFDASVGGIFHRRNYDLDTVGGRLTIGPACPGRRSAS